MFCLAEEVAHHSLCPSGTPSFLAAHVMFYCSTNHASHARQAGAEQSAALRSPFAESKRQADWGSRRQEQFLSRLRDRPYFRKLI